MAALLVAGCSGGGDLVGPAAVASVTLSAPATTVAAGGQLELVAQARDGTGNDVSGVALDWSSSNADVLTVDSHGVVTGHALGQATVRAKAGEHADSIGLTVRAGAAASITFPSPTLSVLAGQTVTLVATVTDAMANPVPSAAVTWSSSDPNIAGVAGDQLTARALGSVTLTATSGGASATLPVTVASVPVASISVAPPSPSVDVGYTATLTATTKDAGGNTLPGRAVTWSSSNPSVATIDRAGVVTGVAPGSATITASAEGRSGTAQLTVAWAPATTVTVTPPSASLLTGQTATLHATAADAGGHPVGNASFNWSSSNTSVATVNGIGVVTPAGPGTATITAATGSATGSASLSVAFGQGAHLDQAGCSPGTQLRMDVFIAGNQLARPLPAAVYVHGGGWNSGDKSGSVWFPELRDSLVDRGFIVVSVDYRLSPGSRWPAQIQDVKCTLRALRGNAASYGLDPNRIGIFGESVGGHLGALTGTTDASAGFDGVGGFSGFPSSVRAVASVSGVYDLTHPGELNFSGPSQTFATWPDSTSSELIGASPVHWASAGDAPTLIIHGELDPKVAPAQARRYTSALQGAGVPVTLQIVTNADHGLQPVNPGPTSPDHLALTRQIVGFLDQYVR